LRPPGGNSEARVRRRTARRAESMCPRPPRRSPVSGRRLPSRGSRGSSSGCSSRTRR
jgi:hypothetical protein